MARTKERTNEMRYLADIYKTAKAGADHLLDLMPYVKDEGMRSQMSRQLNGYEKCAACAKEELQALGESAKEGHAMGRISSRAAATFHTLIDSTTSHVAELMLERVNDNITDMTRILNNAVEEGGTSRHLARDLASFEEYNRAKLMKYL